MLLGFPKKKDEGTQSSLLPSGLDSTLPLSSFPKNTLVHTREFLRCDVEVSRFPGGDTSVEPSLTKVVLAGQHRGLVRGEPVPGVSSRNVKSFFFASPHVAFATTMSGTVYRIRLLTRK